MLFLYYISYCNDIVINENISPIMLYLNVLGVLTLIRLDPMNRKDWHGKKTLVLLTYLEHFL